MQQAMMCPQCNAPLTPSRFSRMVTCAFCGATIKLENSKFISAGRFHQAFKEWNSPETYQFSSWLTIGKSHWGMGKKMANGDNSEVYSGLRARWPTELVVIKILRDQGNANSFENEWNVLQTLKQSTAPGADLFTTLLPQPVTHGKISNGIKKGQQASIFRWSSGFKHSFEAVMQAYPQGIPPRASIWIWRRTLEMLSFIHSSGMIHAAVLPKHLLVQENEHGVKLIGYGAAGRLGEKLQKHAASLEHFRPSSMRSLSALLDIAMSARSMIAILGGNPETGTLPESVPAPLSKLILEIANPPASMTENAWSVREELGVIARNVFGPPQFSPIVMPN